MSGDDTRSKIERCLRKAGLIPTHEVAIFRELAGGVASDIWCVEAGNIRFAVKRALEKLRVAADWRAPVERNAAEAEWLNVAAGISPGSVPRILHHDPNAGFFAMEYLPTDRYPVWKAELRAGRVNPAFAMLVGKTLGRIHGATTGDPSIAARFANDRNFHALRLEPYLEATAHRHANIAGELMALSRETLDCHAALVHGDVSPKNILVGPDGPVFLDAECAWYGEPAFDVAFCLNHLLLKCLWIPSAAGALLESFDAFCSGYFRSSDRTSDPAIEARTARLLPALLLARIDGKSPVEYIVAEADKDFARQIAIRLILGPPTQLHSIRDAWRRGLTSKGIHV